TRRDRPVHPRHRPAHDLGRAVLGELVHHAHLEVVLRIAVRKNGVEACADGGFLLERRAAQRLQRDPPGGPPGGSEHAPEADCEGADDERVERARAEEHCREEYRHAVTSTAAGTGSSSAKRSFRMNGNPASDGPTMLTQNSRNAALNAAAPPTPSTPRKNTAAPSRMPRSASVNDGIALLAKKTSTTPVAAASQPVPGANASTRQTNWAEKTP